MIRRAVADALGSAPYHVEVSDFEQYRNGPSYTYDTLQALHAQGVTPMQLLFITGADAFAEIETWHRYPDVLEAAHFAVVERPGTSFDDLRRRLPALESRMIRPDQLDQAIAPRIVLVQGETPEISATEIRARIGRGESIADFVPASVAAYIDEHMLYASAPASASAASRHGEIPRS